MYNEDQFNQIKNNMKSKWIMGFENGKPVAGKVIDTISPQYPGQEISHKVSWIENYEGWLDEGHYVEYDKNRWNAILNEYIKITVAKQNIEGILGIKVILIKE